MYILGACAEYVETAQVETIN